MNLKSFRHAGSLRASAFAPLGAFTALAVAASVAACSSDPASAVAFVQATLDSQGAAACGLGPTPVVSVGDGSSATASPTTVANGDHGLSIDCSVTPNGGAYTVHVSAKTGGGSFALTGQAKADGGTGMHGYFLTANASFQSSNCTLTYTFQNSGMKSPGISAGAIAGHVDCPDATSTTGFQVGNSPAMCDAFADFEFQNCGQ